MRRKSALSCEAKVLKDRECARIRTEAGGLEKMQKKRENKSTKPFSEGQRGDGTLNPLKERESV